MFGRTPMDSTQAPGIAPDDIPEGLDRAAFAAGCFWGVEEFFRHHAPPTLNRQGPDHGTQYRSAVFTHDEAQEKAARAALDDFRARFERTIVTEVAPASTFWPAEEYHQRFTERTGRGGCHVANW